MPFLQVRLAKGAREFAVVAMQKEPQDDLAQHLMGRQAPPDTFLGMPAKFNSICDLHTLTLQPCPI